MDPDSFAGIRKLGPAQNLWELLDEAKQRQAQDQRNAHNNRLRVMGMANMPPMAPQPAQQPQGYAGVNLMQILSQMWRK